MIPRALRYISREVRGLHAAVYVLALVALVTALVGLLRDRLLAHVFGASSTLDLYYAAFRVPDLLFVAMGALVSVYILIPELARRSQSQQSDYIDTIVSGFSLLSIIICSIAFLIAPWLLPLLFPKLVSSLPILTSMTRIMLLQPILFGFSNIFAAITQSKKRYLLYSISPLLYNLGTIAGVLLFFPLIGITGLAWGVVLGAGLHAGIQLPSIFEHGFFSRLPRLRDTKALARTVFISVPRALALSMSEIAELGLIALAGGLAPGSISIFIFAYNLQSVPLSIIGSSYSIAAFPTLAAALAEGKKDEFVEHAATAARHVVFWSLPATALIIVLRAHLVRVILGSGQFDWTATRLTAAALALFSLSLAAQGLMLLIVRAYYAAGRTFVPFLISAGIMILTIFFGAAAVGVPHIAPAAGYLAAAILRVTDVPGATVLALSFTYALVSIIGTVALIWHFEHRFGGFIKQVYRSWGQSLVAAIGCAAAAYLALSAIGPITFSSTVLTVLLRGLVAGVAGIVVCVVVYALLGSREYAENLAAIQARLWRKHSLEIEPVVAAEDTQQS